MAEFPVASITTQQIAAKASVSTATVYRWWSTKEALLLDAFLHSGELLKSHLRDQGSPLERLREHIIGFAYSLEGKRGRVAARLLAAIQDDEALRQAFIRQAYLPQCGSVRAIAEEAVAAGELPAGTNVELLLDMIFGTVLTRLLLRHEPVKAADIEKAFELAIAGARECLL